MRSTALVVEVATSTTSAGSSAGKSGLVLRIEVRATILNANVHWGIFIVSESEAATKGDVAAPNIVEVVEAIIVDGPKTAAAHPTKHPLYPNKPFSMVCLSRPAVLAADVAVTAPSAAKHAKVGSPTAKPPSKIPPAFGEFKKIT